jgi:hypothetical protein
MPCRFVTVGCTKYTVSLPSLRCLGSCWEAHGDTGIDYLLVNQ